jgi:hypothetical protein
MLEGLQINCDEDDDEEEGEYTPSDFTEVLIDDDVRLFEVEDNIDENSVESVIQLFFELEIDTLSPASLLEVEEIFEIDKEGE